MQTNIEKELLPLDLEEEAAVAAIIVN